MKYHRKSRKSSSARTICGHRPLPSSNVRRRLLMRKIFALEERLYLQEAVLLAALHHLGFKSITSLVSVPTTLH